MLLKTDSPRTQTREWISQSPDETFAIGKTIGEQLTGGEIILLNGPLGAGKTILVKGIAAALALEPGDVTSPSFTLVNPHEGRLLLFHIDLYRLSEGAEAAHAVDLDELLTNEAAVIVIEWADRLRNYPLPGQVWRIAIQGDGNEPRIISISTSQEEPTIV